MTFAPEYECVRRTLVSATAFTMSAAAFLVAGCATAPDHGSCVDASVPRGESRASIELNLQPQGPFFYLRSVDNHFAIVVPPQRAVDLLKTGDRTSQELLELLQKDMPITSDTDLFRYALRDSFYLKRIEDTTAELLARGEASLFYAGTGEYLSTVEVKKENYPEGRSRTFHEPIGKEMIASTHDCVSD